MLNFQQLNLTLCCIFLGSAFVSDLGAQERSFPFRRGRVIQQQPIQGQVIQGQPIQGQIIYGQPVQGQPVQGQPVQGQIIQGQPIQGTIIQGPIIQQGPVVSREIIQGQSIPADASRAKIAEQEKRIKTLTDENLRLGAFEKSNSSLKSENARLEKAFEEASSTWELQNKSAMQASQERVAQMKELAQLKIQYQNSAKQNGAMAGKVDALSQENAGLKKQLTDGGNDGSVMEGLQANLNAATTKLSKFGQQNKTLNQQNKTLKKQSNALSGQIKTLTQENVDLAKRIKGIGNPGDAMKSLESELKSATSSLSELGEKNETLGSENSRLQGLIDTANKDKQQLRGRVSVLSDDIETLRTQFQSASQEKTSLDNRVSELSLQNRNYATSVNSLKSDMRKNSKSNAALATASSTPAINEGLESENSLLMKQVSDLQGEVAQFNRDAQLNRELETGAIAVSTPMPLDLEASGKFNVMRWIIPFLLIGLGVGLYTYFMEEFRGVKDTSMSKT